MGTYGGHMERASESILYIETDIPPRMTCTDWRRSKLPPRRRFISRLRARRAAAVEAASARGSA
jgi:hypothetical protein